MKEDIDLLRALASRINIGERLTRDDAIALMGVADRLEAPSVRRKRVEPPQAGEPEIIRRLHWFRYSWASSTMDQIIADAAIDEIRRMDRRMKEMESREQINIQKELYDGEG